MHSSDPMGERPGRILLNGNAESIDRFVHLANRTLGPSTHRDEEVRGRDAILVSPAAWGPTELNDAAVRRGFARSGRGHGGRYVDNLGIHTAMTRFLAERPVVAALYEEHEAVWRELYTTYTMENDATVAHLRRIWARCNEVLPELTMHDLLATARDLPPGPRTRPTRVFLRTAFANQLRRLVADLAEADERHASALKQLWTHFHLAAGIEFDGLWQETRARLLDSVLNASALVIPGGSPSRLLVGFRFFAMEYVVTEAVRRGISIFGTSAGAMCLGRRVVVFNDKGNPRQEFQILENGLRLVEGLQIFPHVTDRVQTEDPANLAYLAARFHHRACVGLNQGSVLELMPAGGRWRATSVGDEDVVVFGRTGEKHRYPPGATVTDI
ncbi:MAG: Type 1 glutamine amidotransferase-like domain-containing protein [Myxococcales bacterium]|nr:Type 1 glutamine amidotransferase-like domain-containing protein [Myxococcales bacterium]